MFRKEEHIPISYQWHSGFLFPVSHFDSFVANLWWRPQVDCNNNRFT